MASLGEWKPSLVFIRKFSGILYLAILIAIALSNQAYVLPVMPYFKMWYGHLHFSTYVFHTTLSSQNSLIIFSFLVTLQILVYEQSTKNTFLVERLIQLHFLTTAIIGNSVRPLVQCKVAFQKPYVEGNADQNKEKGMKKIVDLILVI
jgi:hypothetical protein